MNATIDIKTPAGQSLEGFPLNFEPQFMSFDLSINGDFGMTSIYFEGTNIIKLHPGDTITITILP